MEENKNLFGIDEKIVHQALVSGIIVKTDNGTFTVQHGFISLTYIAAIEKFIFTYGTSTENAKYVFVDEYKKTWDLK